MLRWFCRIGEVGWCRWRTGDGAIGVRMALFCGGVCRAKCAVLERKRFFFLSIGGFFAFELGLFFARFL